MRTPARIAGILTVLVAALAAARALVVLPEGLTATYFTDVNWSSAPAMSAVEPNPSTASVVRAWRRRPPETFSATWSGSLLVLRPGTYTFASESDDGSWVYVDKQLVVDNPGRHSKQLARGTIQLDRGVHAIFVRYFQGGGPLDLELAWARDGSPLGPIPSWALSPRSPAFASVLLSIVVARALRFLLWVWIGAVAGVGVLAARHAMTPLPLRDRVQTGLLFVGLVLLLVVLPHRIEGDGSARFQALAELIEQHRVSDAAYSLVGPICSVPLYLLGKVWQTPEWWCARFNVIVFIAGVAWAYWLLRRHVDAAVTTTFLLILTAASMFPHHLETYYGEVFTSILAAVGLLAVQSGRQAAGWTAAIIGVANTPGTIFALGASVLVQVWRTRRWRYFVPLAVAVALIMLESWIRRGSPVTTGYEARTGFPTVLPYSGRSEFGYPLFFGLLSVLFSFGKGILFYAPGIMLPVRKRLERSSVRLLDSYVLWVAFLVGVILTYSRWWSWYGGWFWGPRFYLFASIPASLALAVSLRPAAASRLGPLLATLAVLTLSAWVAVAGVIYDPSTLGACQENFYSLEFLCWYVPEFSPLWRPFIVVPHVPRSMWAIVSYLVVVYIWLAAPVAVAIARQIREHVGELARTYARPSAWRF